MARCATLMCFYKPSNFSIVITEFPGRICLTLFCFWFPLPYSHAYTTLFPINETPSLPPSSHPPKSSHTHPQLGTSSYWVYCYVNHFSFCPLKNNCIHRMFLFYYIYIVHPNSNSVKCSHLQYITCFLSLQVPATFVGHTGGLTEPLTNWQNILVNLAVVGDFVDRLAWT